MPLKTLVVTALLTLSPALAFAECYGSAHSAADQQAMSCAEGTAWDATSSTCVPVTTS